MSGNGALTFTITPAMILEAKKRAVEELISKVNASPEYPTGSLRDLGYIIKDDKIYIVKGMDIIATV